MNNISKNIKKLRLENGYTQSELAEKLNVTHQTISSYETGRTLPDINILSKLAEIYNVNIEELLYSSESEQKKLTNSIKITAIVSGILAVMIQTVADIICIIARLKYPMEDGIIDDIDKANKYFDLINISSDLISTL